MEHLAGVDIGGTKIRWVYMHRRDGSVAHAAEIPTPHGKREFLQALSGILERLYARGVRHTGIGFPGIVKNGVVIEAHNLPLLEGVSILPVIPRGMKFTIDNDARCFARAEARIGTGRGARRILALTFGTGVGRALAENGTPAKIPRFVRPEKWESEARVQLSKKPAEIARFLAADIAPIIREFKPDAVIIGGGLMRRPKMFQLIRRELRRTGVSIPVRRSRFHQNGAAIGAALL